MNKDERKYLWKKFWGIYTEFPFPMILGMGFGMICSGIYSAITGRSMIWIVFVSIGFVIDVVCPIILFLVFRKKHIKNQKTK